MGKYNEYLAELKSTTLFQDIADDELLALLDAMQPRIIMRKAGEPMPPMEEGKYWMALRSTPARELAPRQFKYDMPKFGEPGMLMAEIPTYSRMKDGLPKTRKSGPPHKMKNLDYDLEMLEFSEYMLTDFYGEQYTKAQGIMLRNLLGILAQKVMDVRHELFLIKDGRDVFMRTENTLQIFTAGVAMGVVKEAVQQWNLKHPEFQAEMHPGGSVDLVRKVLSGERCDVLVTADDTLISSMMMPQAAKGYVSFAGNKMVVVAKGDKDINSENWKEKLLAPDATFAHKNPYGDPGGYRGVMALLLADQVEEGLADKLMNHKGHIGMDKNLNMGNMPKHDYSFEYYSGAASRGMKFAELPEVMDQSNTELAETYAKAAFAVDDDNTVVCTPISHGITIPENAKYKDAAKEFVTEFLKTDFTKRNFLPRREVVGEDILK